MDVHPTRGCFPRRGGQDEQVGSERWQRWRVSSLMKMHKARPLWEATWAVP